MTRIGSIFALVLVAVHSSLADCSESDGVVLGATVYLSASALAAAAGARALALR